jgi:tetratricopeptide (TPR) repeat protein
MGEINFDIAKDFISKAGGFSEKYPEDPMAAEFLYRSGLMAMTVAKASNDLEEVTLYSKKALIIFDDIQKIYPDFSGVKNCIINKGIIYEDILLDYDSAEFFYREFIAKYPTDTLAVNLESYLPYLGKSPEEIMSGFGK